MRRSFLQCQFCGCPNFEVTLLNTVACSECKRIAFNDLEEMQMAQDKLQDKLGNIERLEHTDDPWKHRSKTMCCKTCMWFVPKAISGPSNSLIILGRCRRHAPTMSGYPAVFETDWCGDHKLDENKI